MNPILNLKEITDFQDHDQGSFSAKYANISSKIGAKKLGYNLTIIPAGKKSWPFHNHHVQFQHLLKHHEIDQNVA